MPKKRNPGGCQCCNCTGLSQVCVTSLDDQCSPAHAIPGASVVLTDTATSAVIGSTTTDTSGAGCVAYTHATSATLTVTGDCGSVSQNLTIICNNTENRFFTLPGANITLQYSSACVTPGAISGASVTLTGTNVSATKTPNTSGDVSFCVPAFGSYTAVFTDTAGCWQGQTDTITVSACTQLILLTVAPLTYTLTITVLGCNNRPVSGAAWSLSGDAGSASGTTGSDGVITATGFKARCGYSLSVTKGRFNAYSGTGSMGCANTSDTINLTAATGYQCFCGCADPVNDPVTVSDIVGTNGLLSTAGGYTTTGCLYNAGATGHCVAGPPPSCGISGSGVAYDYGISCDDSLGTVTLSRTMPNCGSATIGPGWPSTCVSGAISCPAFSAICNAAGQDPCFTSGTGLTEESVTVSIGSCPLTTLSFAFTFGFSDTAVVNF